MKKWIGVLLLCLLTVVAMFASVAVHKLAVPFNCVPLLIWIAVIAICQRRCPSLGSPAAVILGIGYGALAGVGAAAFLNSLAISMLTDRYGRYPYDSAAFAMILLLSLILFIGLAVFDYVKFRFKPLWVRIVTALVAFLPCMLAAMHIMAYFEEKLSHLVR